ncbi:MAG: translation initiation factor IF-2 [Paludibacteraceae bacterium]|nr:translation initiation factor IF-2 [Paludibacteraceae bacterium]
MSIRLSKIAKELNVGISTAVDFLEKRGHTISSDPNYKLSDEMEELLYNEFSKDKNMKIESNKVTQQRQTKDKKSKAESRESSKKEEEIKTVIPEDQLPKIKQVGKINLDNLNNTTKNEAAPTVEAPQANEPQGESETPATPVVEGKNETPAKQDEPQEIEETVAAKESESNSEPAESTDQDVFSLGKVEVKTNINVVGKIDLAAINQQTRPKKKSKEERKKEREQRRMPNGKADDSAMVKTNVPKLNGPKVVGNIDVSGDRKKRKRIQNERVNIAEYSKQGGNQGGEKNANGKPQQNNNNGKQGDKNNKKKDFGKKQPVVKPEVSDEAVQKQIKETLARLTGKGQKTTTSKHRRDKRELQSLKQQEMEEQERQNQSKLKITEFVTVSELATMMDVPVTKVIGTCMSLGLMVSINQRLDAETINIVAEEFGFETEYISAEVAEAIHEEEDAEEDLVRRPPIVTVMGHVDHGKTSLLDYIRKTNVIAGEAGGITQHIGAYNVTLADGQQITFLDTPGHEAFTAMRARGAKVTDIAIIIVAADDDVMPQTIEAINHASVAGVPIVFAINKIDKPTANPDKIKESLANMNYLVEEWGGKYQSQDIAAKKGTGVNELMEKVLLEAEMLDLKANPNRRATGSIIESQLDKGRGYVSTVLVSNGTLKVGDVVVAGTNHGKIKAMFNERNQRIKEARPSEPALILGLDGAPQAGDNFNVLPTEQEAREVANKRLQLQREQGLRTSRHLTLDEIGRRIALGNFQELNVIVKGDVDGSIEALSDSLLKLSTEQIQVNVIHKAVGQISESDVMLAAASNAIIVGFQVRPSVAARKIAEKEEIDIRLYSIIYDAIEEVKSAMEGMLSPELKEEITGSAEVQEVFKITKVGTIAGCMVREGKIKRTNKVRLIRDGIVVYTGELASLKRFKDDAKEVVSGLDCGLNIQNYNDIQVGDIIEGFEQIEVQRKL